MKDRKFFFITLGLGLLLAVCILSAPNGYAHRDQVKEELYQLMAPQLKKSTGASVEVNHAIVGYTVDHSLYVDDYYLCTVGRMVIGGSEVRTSIGFLGHVFLINEDRVREEVNRLNMMR